MTLEVKTGRPFGTTLKPYSTCTEFHLQGLKVQSRLSLFTFESFYQKAFKNIFKDRYSGVGQILIRLFFIDEKVK